MDKIETVHRLQLKRPGRPLRSTAYKASDDGDKCATAHAALM
jgi:hypothetical protein